MEKLLMCRICLTTDVTEDSILKSHLQEIYEKLTSKLFETKDNRPLLACYVCCARLENTQKLSMTCLRSEELLTRMLSGDIVSPLELKYITQTMKLRTTRVVVESFLDSLSAPDDDNHDDRASKDFKEAKGFDKDTNLEEDIKEEPLSEDFQYSAPEDEIPLDIVKHEIDTVPNTNLEEDIKEEPLSEDFQYSAPEDEIPLDIVKHEIDTVPNTNLQEDIKEEPLSEDFQYSAPEDEIPLDIVKHEIDTVPSGVIPYKPTLPTQDSLENSAFADHKDTEPSQANVNELKTKYDVVKETDLNEFKKNKEAVTSQHRTHICSICKVNFRYKYILERHVRTHYQCVNCNRCFAGNDALIRHMRTHTVKSVKKVYSYKCNQCFRGFTEKHKLDAHYKRRHIGRQPFQCINCKIYFLSKAYFLKHRCTHTGAKPYQCKICQKSHSAKSSLAKHMRTHTGEKPYQCNICNKCFAANAVLVKHMRIHSGEKPHQFNQCNERFTEKHVLNDHTYARTHNFRDV